MAQVATSAARCGEIAQHFSLGLSGYGILSAIVDLVDLINEEQGKFAVGHHSKAISLCISISLIAFTVSAGPPSVHVSRVCMRVSFFFSILTCTFLLSPAVPHRLWWIPHFASFLALCQLLLGSLRLHALLQLCHAICSAARNVVRRIRSAISGSPRYATSEGIPKQPTSSPSAERISEEGDIAAYMDSSIGK